MNLYTLTSLVDYLNGTFVKTGKKKFTVSDVQGYIRRGYLPTYLDRSYKLCITLHLDIPGAKVYKLERIKKI